VTSATPSELAGGPDTPEQAARSINADDLPLHQGRHLGYSRWHLVTQDRIDRFADATADHSWLHVDPERAARGRFGATVAHGFLTLALFTGLLDEIVRIDGAITTINYGVNRVRFPAAVRTGARVRLGVVLARVDQVDGGVQATWQGTFEIEEEPKPACVAEVLFRYYP
jgi:acyl dehydratase